MRGAYGKTALAACVATLALALSSCGLVESDAEREAKYRSAEIGAQLRPAGVKPELPELKAETSFADYLRFALLNSPEVESAYYAWLSSVRAIAVARSLPDPRLTFQMDMQRGFIPSIMPGVQFDFPAPGKLEAAAGMASAEGDAKYQALLAAVSRTAFALEKACWDLRFLDAKLKSLRASLKIVSDMEAQAEALNASGAAKLQDVLRAQIEEERLRTEIRDLEDSRVYALASFKAALGLQEGRPTPPLPAKIPSFPLEAPLRDKLMAEALKRNPGLKSLEAEIRRAEASLSMAHKAGLPDFGVGAEVNAVSIPVMLRPMASMTLPIWREKTSSGIAAARAAKRSAEAKLDAAQIKLAVDCAESVYFAKESARNMEILDGSLIPKARSSLEAAKLSYSAGKADFLTLLDAERVLLSFDIELAAARLRHDLSMASLVLVVAGATPPEAEFLQSRNEEKAK